MTNSPESTARCLSPQNVRDLIAAAKQASDVLADTYNAEVAAGNDPENFDDVQAVEEAMSHLDRALAAVDAATGTLVPHRGS